MDAAAYIRVSSPKQNYELQVSALTKMSAARGDTLTAIYYEKVTGTTLERPELKRMRQAARQGELPRRLYLYALDRLMRTGIIDTLAAIRDLHGFGIEVFSYSEPFDFAGPTAEPMIAFAAWVSQQEVKKQKGRRDEKREAMEARGEHWGRPPNADPDDPRRVRALEMKLSELTVREIAQLTGLGRGCVQRYIADAGLSRKSGGKTGTTKRR